MTCLNYLLGIRVSASIAVNSPDCKAKGGIKDKMFVLIIYISTQLKCISIDGNV